MLPKSKVLQNDYFSNKYLLKLNKKLMELIYRARLFFCTASGTPPETIEKVRQNRLVVHPGW